MTYTETTPSAANEVAKNEHITSLLWILPELYLLLLHKPATFILTHPWQSNHCSTSAQTQQHDHLTFHSLPTPQHATIAHTPPLGQTSTSPGPRLPPRPTNLTLKTFSTLSLPMQTTTFNAMNAVNLDVCTSPPPPIHLSSTVMRSSAKSTKKTWYSFLSPLTPGHRLARCYRHSSPPPTTPAKNLGAPHTLTPNITDPKPTSCTNAPPNHHAHSGSSYPPTSDGRNLHHHHQHDRRSLVTPTLHPHQASILYNSSDLAYLRHTTHYYVMLRTRMITLRNLSNRHPNFTTTWTWRMKCKGTAEWDKQWIYSQPDYKVMARGTGIMQTFCNVRLRSPIYHESYHRNVVASIRTGRMGKIKGYRQQRQHFPLQLKPGEDQDELPV